MKSTIAAIAFVFCITVPGRAVTQVTTAHIVGRITDNSGAVLPGATITIENLDRRATRSAASNESDDYVFNLSTIRRKKTLAEKSCSTALLVKYTPPTFQAISARGC